MELTNTYYIPKTPVECTYAWAHDRMNSFPPIAEAQYDVTEDADGRKVWTLTSEEIPRKNKQPYGLDYEQKGYTWEVMPEHYIINEIQSNVASQLDWITDSLSKIDDQVAKNAADITAILTVPESVLTPLGGIIMWADEQVPEGFMRCDGQALDRLKYADLFDVIGTSFGKSNNSDFRLPDYRGEFMRATDRGRGIDPDSSRELGSKQSDELQLHTHPAEPDNQQIITWRTGGKGAELDNDSVIGNYKATPLVDEAGGKETRPVNIYTDFIMKVKLT